MKFRGLIIYMCALALTGISPGAEAGQATTLKGVLLSPGALAAAHDELSDKCESCHSGFSRKSQGKLCLDCHEAIRADLNGKRRFHGRLQNAECSGCHAEHLGEKSDITGLDKDRFDHSLTAFPLLGRHKMLDCKQCHKDAWRKESKLPGRFRLKRQACAGCHDDPHNGKLPGDCASCHTEVDWHRTGFDHARTHFPLEGKHAEALCVACHKDAWYEAPTECIGCHEAGDIHRGTMGSKCGECHGSASWHTVKFEHDKTRFSLGKSHAQVQCALCHTGKPHQFDWLFTGKIRKQERCAACHRRDDMHAGIYGSNCSLCHRNGDWEKATFDHSRSTSFALEGRHKTVACVACHAPGKEIDRRHPRSACLDCHGGDDVHQGSLGKTCTDCHSVRSRWTSTTFSHDFTAFPVTGMHKLLACNACHATQRFRSERDSCEECHQVGDVHKGVFKTQCDGCHNTREWPTWEFEHSRTTFPLVGAHEKMGCFDCHLSSQPVLSKRSTCYDCHAGDDVHDQQFGRRCENCHSQSSFEGAVRRTLR